MINYQDKGKSKGKTINSISRPPVAIAQRGGEGMDYERWVMKQMDVLKMKSMTSDLTSTGVQLPSRLSEKLFKVNVDDRNTKGETLMIAVIRYILDELKQIQYLNILVRMDADPNLSDTKHQRTPIMYACLYKRVVAARVLMNHPKLLLGLKDCLGNTALMYAALQGEQTIIDLLTIRLSKSWSLDAFTTMNRKGRNAESVAILNDKPLCATILKSNRLRMLQRMHKQLALINYSAQLRGWKGYTEAYRAAKIWQSKRAKRRANSSLPGLSQYMTQDGNVISRQTHAYPESRTQLSVVRRPRAKSCG